MVYVTDVIKKQFRSFEGPRMIIKWSDPGHSNKLSIQENIFRTSNWKKTDLLQFCGDGTSEFSFLLLVEIQYFSTFKKNFIYNCIQTQQILNYTSSALQGLLAK